MKKIVSIMLALSTLVAAPSSAADLIIESPVVYAPDSIDWSGFYAGVLTGGGVGTATSTSTVSGNTSSFGLAGGLLGASVGYNQQTDNYVLGAEGELLWSSIAGTARCNNPLFSCSGTINWLTAAKVKAGVAYDALLIFGDLGVAAGGFVASTNPAPGVSTGSFTGIALGWTIGAGVELAIAENTSLKAQYSYYNLGARAPANTVDTPAIDLSSSVHTAKVGFNFKF